MHDPIWLAIGSASWGGIGPRAIRSASTARSIASNARPGSYAVARWTRRLVESLDLLGHLLALEHAEPLGELERDAARHAGDVLGGGELEQRT